MLGAVDSRVTVSSHAAGSLTSAAAYFDSTIVLARAARTPDTGRRHGRLAERVQSLTAVS